MLGGASSSSATIQPFLLGNVGFRTAYKHTVYCRFQSNSTAESYKIGLRQTAAVNKDKYSKVAEYADTRRNVEETAAVASDSRRQEDKASHLV